MRHKRTTCALLTICCVVLLLGAHHAEALEARPADAENSVVRPIPNPNQDRVSEESRRGLGATNTEAREPIELSPASTTPEARSAPTEFTERLTEHRNSFAKKIQERIYNLTQNIVGRMNAAVFRLSNIADRIDSRTQKMKMAGTNVAEIETEIQTARAALEKARTALSLDVSSFIYGDEPKKRFTGIKTTFSESRTNLMEARASLERALVLLKNNGQQPPETGTTTKPELAS